jgi:fructose-1-phosphate kinase PfkB-like protein
VPIREESRRGFPLYDDAGQDTTVYGPRVHLRDSEVDAIVATVRCLMPAEMIVLGGSCSRPELYGRLAHLGIPIVVDADGPGLELALAGDVFLAKPNMREVAETLGALDAQRALLELSRRNARNAVVTDGGGEAWFKWQGKTFRVMPPKVDVVHTIGCGDALCAGLIHASSRPAEEAVAFAMACGAQSATSDGVAGLDERACEALARQIQVNPA